MILLFIDKSTATDIKAFVSTINYFPEQLPQEVVNSGFLIDSIPQPIDNGKVPLLYINPQTKELWYEYVDKQPTPEDKILELQSQNAQMLLALVNGGLM